MSAILPGSRSYYLDAFTDELLPCGTSLEAWAEWLSKPDREWGRPEAAADRSTWPASVIRWEQDLICTRRADGSWRFSRDVEGEPAVIAVRFACGLGWDPENIFGSIAELKAALTGEDENYQPPESFFDDVEHVAIGRAEGDVVLLYLAHPPRLILQGVKQ